MIAVNVDARKTLDRRVAALRHHGAHHIGAAQGHGANGSWRDFDRARAPARSRRSPSRSLSACRTTAALAGVRGLDESFVQHDVHPPQE